MVPLSFAGQVFIAGDAPALYWPRHETLLVADLHLEKASAFAGLGQFLPPYDSLATIDSLSAAIDHYRPRRVVCLGDNFHDSEGEWRLGGRAGSRLRELTQRFDWWWIGGNHDRAVTGRWGGRSVDSLNLDGILLTHEPVASAVAQIVGHFHPRLRLRSRHRSIWKPCFVAGDDLLIMPAFGALTGGLDVRDPVIAQAAGPGPVTALVPVAGRLARFSVQAERRIGRERPVAIARQSHSSGP